MNFNVNDYVLVKLTKRGIQLYNQYYRELGIGMKYMPKLETDSEGWSRFQLWNLMQIFGSHMSMGHEVPFETNIRLEDPKELEAVKTEAEVLKSANAQLSVILDERDTELREALRWKPKWLPFSVRNDANGPEEWLERTEKFIKELQSSHESAESRIAEALGLVQRLSTFAVPILSGPGAEEWREVVAQTRALLFVSESKPREEDGCRHGKKSHPCALSEVERLRGILSSIERELDRPDEQRKWHGQIWCIRQRVERGLRPAPEDLPLLDGSVAASGTPHDRRSDGSCGKACAACLKARAAESKPSEGGEREGCGFRIQGQCALPEGHRESCCLPSTAALRQRVEELTETIAAFVRDIELTNTHANHKALCDLNAVLLSPTPAEKTVEIITLEIGHVGQIPKCFQREYQGVWPPVKEPVCSTCNDTHMMTLGSDRTAMCTGCPTPCQKCRAGGNGPYCEKTPCSCECHAVRAQYKVKRP